MDYFLFLRRWLLLVGLLFVSGFANAAFYTPKDACIARHDTGGYASNLTYVDSSPVTAGNIYNVHCYFAENGSGHYNLFDTTWQDPPPPPPPTCAIGTKRPGVNWNVGWRTGPDSNSPTTGLQTPAQIANQKFCDGTCTYGVDNGPGAPGIDVHSDKSPDAKGYYAIVATAGFSSTGGTCSSGAPDVPQFGGTTPDMAQEPAAPSPGTNKCPVGTTSGGIDSGGTPICIGTGSGPSTKTDTTSPTTTTTAPDGTKTDKTTTTSTNSDGSTTTTTKTTTTGADGSTSTRTESATGPSSSGVPGKSDSGKSDKPSDNDLCKLHPELNVCKNSSVAGACAETSCEGDAIQCAILRQDRQVYCENTKTNDLADLGKLLGSGADPLASTLPSASKATDVDLGAAAAGLDQSGWLGGGQCMPDRTVSVAGRSLTIPFSKACDGLTAFRLAVMLMALMFSYRMISGTILREV